MKKYKDDERPANCCYDCKISYGSFPDLTISDDLWEQINPTYHKGAGLLCPTCTAKRLAKIKVGKVSCTIHTDDSVVKI